ncbi:hypothetical protein, partial [Desulfococcus multivorans]
QASFRAARSKLWRHLNETAWGVGRILPAPAYENRQLNFLVFSLQPSVFSPCPVTMTKAGS